jgi:hypothetical protein
VDRLGPLPGRRGKFSDPAEKIMGARIVSSNEHRRDMQRQIRIKSRVNHVLKERTLAAAAIEQERDGCTEEWIIGLDQIEWIRSNDRADGAGVHTPIRRGRDRRLRQRYGNAPHRLVKTSTEIVRRLTISSRETGTPKTLK